MERFRLKYESSTQRPRSGQKAMTTMMRENGSAMNSRIVRPREILAMNRPKNGAQEIHQAQYTMEPLFLGALIGKSAEG